MKHEIDLSKYKIRTDLAIESIPENLEIKTKEIDNIKISKLYINEEISKQINKKIGNYITIEFEDITDEYNKEKVKEIFIKELKQLLKDMNIKKEDSCLIIGLGNRMSTPDALGPKTIDNLIITNHLYKLGMLDEKYRRVSALNPGVMGTTGIETSDIIESISKKTKPEFIIVIDALASSSIERVNKTIQITDTGIHPGSGIGNSRKEISKDLLNIPVIAIGVPTTVDAVTIVSDTINYLTKHYSYTRKNINNPMNKLIIKGNVNYLKKEIKIDKNEKKELLGLIGNLDEEETRRLIYETLTPIGYNFMVTPKEIDFIIDKLTDIIGNGLNETLHDI
ncbi:MAG: GPR endopeptidase [Bacilli bacterium]